MTDNVAEADVGGIILIAMFLLAVGGVIGAAIYNEQHKPSCCDLAFGPEPGLVDCDEGGCAEGEVFCEPARTTGWTVTHPEHGATHMESGAIDMEDCTPGCCEWAGDVLVPAEFATGRA